MTRRLMLSVTVKDDERAFLTCNGRLTRVLEPGRHRFLDPLRKLAIETHNVVRAELPADRFTVLKAALPEVAAMLFEAVETRGGEIAIVSLDGRPAHLVGPWQLRAFWKVATRVDVERIDVASHPKVEPRHLAMIERTKLATLTAGVRTAQPFVAETVVENHEAGLLYVEGKLVERLAPGRHAYWTVDRKVEVKRLDLRPQAVEITA